jgi:NAD(P)-dependent dehydrogenase (short-subunit alcohol dehydrogenase family)
VPSEREVNQVATPQSAAYERQGRELDGKVALVTGAGSGIGRATAVAFARAGATIGLLGRTEQSLREVEEEVAALGERGVVLVADVSRPNEVAGAVSQLLAREGHLDIVFANAGFNGVWAPIEELELDEWHRTFDTNFHGTFYTIKNSVPHLKSGSSIVICSSVNGTRMFSNTGGTAYACAKSAQAAMGKMLAVELGRRGIRVNVVCPGFIDTDISAETEKRHLEHLPQPVNYPEGPIPMTGKKAGSPQQVADVVLFLASDRASHVNGTELWIDGGQSLVQG